MYMNDADQTVYYDNNDSTALWMGVLSNQIASRSILVCPSTRIPSTLASSDVAGTANLAWTYGYDVAVPFAGSYGFNSWFYNFAPGPNLFGSGTSPDFVFTKPTSVQNPSQTPLFFDAVWWDAWPLESDPPANDLYAGQVAQILGIQRCTIIRHGGKTATASVQYKIGMVLPGAINIGFDDGHADLVKLKDLWKCYWHLNWKPH